MVIDQTQYNIFLSVCQKSESSPGQSAIPLNPLAVSKERLKL